MCGDGRVVDAVADCMDDGADVGAAGRGDARRVVPRRLIGERLPLLYDFFLSEVAGYFLYAVNNFCFESIDGGCLYVSQDMLFYLHGFGRAANGVQGVLPRVSEQWFAVHCF